MYTHRTYTHAYTHTHTHTHTSTHAHTHTHTHTQAHTHTHTHTSTHSSYAHTYINLVYIMVHIYMYIRTVRICHLYQYECAYIVSLTVLWSDHLTVECYLIWLSLHYTLLLPYIKFYAGWNAVLCISHVDPVLELMVRCLLTKIWIFLILVSKSGHLWSLWKFILRDITVTHCCVVLHCTVP